MKMLVLNGLAFLEAYAQLPLRASVIIMLTTCPHPADLAQAEHLRVGRLSRHVPDGRKVASLLREQVAT